MKTKRKTLQGEINELVDCLADPTTDLSDAERDRLQRLLDCYNGTACVMDEILAAQEVVPAANEEGTVPNQKGEEE